MKVAVLLFCFFFVHVALADNQKIITLEMASNSAGLNAGAQQKLLKEGIDFSRLQAGIESSYETKLNHEQIESAREKAAVFPLPNKKVKLNQSQHSALQVASFELGIALGGDAQENLKTISVVSYMEGFKRGYTHNISSPELAAATLEIMNYFNQQRLKGADESLKKSTLFLESNKNRAGVITTKSGLQYEILNIGNGPSPTIVDMVTVNYRHTKPDSDFMYDSAEHGHSETMAMRGAIPEGWRELFLLMKKGAKYRVYLPPAIGFGIEGNGEALLPNEVLISEFTLLDIIPPPSVNY